MRTSKAKPESRLEIESALQSSYTKTWMRDRNTLAKTKKKTGQRKTDVGVTFDDVRQLALGLPGVEEGTSYGTPAFRASRKILARFHQDGESLVLKVEFVTREVLTATQPDMFYVTDHYRCWPFMLIRLKNVDLNLLRGLIEEAWRGLAPKRAIAEYEARD